MVRREIYREIQIEREREGERETKERMERMQGDANRNTRGEGVAKMGSYQNIQPNYRDREATSVARK